MKGSLYTILYAAVLATVCALLLTGVGRFTYAHRTANARAEQVRHVLAVLGVPLESGASARELTKAFEKCVRVDERGGLRLYRYVEDGCLRAVAVPFAGRGLWGPIEGFLALEPDLKTIRGVTFHRQEETPGLGGEIASAAFTGRFKGKTIRVDGGAAGLSIRRGASGARQVEAISGATMTCTRVEAMLNELIARISGEVADDVR